MFERLIALAMQRPDALILAIKEHLILVSVPIGFAILVSVPLGIAAARWKAVGTPVLALASVLQTIPSLALLAFMIPLGLGIGRKPAMVALFLYSLLPILRNTYTGITEVDESVKEAALGMGMTYLQRLYIVELPIAFSIIMAGVRTAAVISIGTATLAALIGGGGLGHFIVTGLGMVRDEFILLGALPAAAMALVVDFVLGKLENIVTPRGLKITNGTNG
ncbi:MAG: ABC transporter permease [Firmicutes bacterium]|nr:ABC transporter permease [Bacillota bacterium]